MKKTISMDVHEFTDLLIEKLFDNKDASIDFHVNNVSHEPGDIGTLEVTSVDIHFDADADELFNG